ncbi:MAG: dTMP kinase [Desulfovibrio sp.]
MLVVIEGIDGSGKGTQAQLLQKRLEAEGTSCTMFTFPNYDTTFFGHEVGRYLNGEFGGLADLPAELVSMLYAGDRFEKRDEIYEALEKYDVVICDRYVPSNLAHQVAKVPDEKKLALSEWIERLEYDVYKLPRPDAVVWLDMPVDVAMGFVLKKKGRSYTEEKMDMHEASKTYLNSARAAYEQVALRQKWVHVEGCPDMAEGPKSIDAIHEEIYNEVVSRCK